MIIAPELEYIAYNNKSILKKISPFTKFFMLILYLFLNLFLSGYSYFFYLFFVFLILIISKIEFRHLLKPFIISLITGIVIFIAKMHFLKRGSPINFLIDFYPESFGNALISGLRVVNGVVLVIIFISTTTIKEVLSVLKRLKIPDIFIEVFLIMFKYIFILNDEGLKIKNAQTVRLGYCGFRRSLESLGNLIGMIMLRGINKGSAMSEALYVRGYRGRFFYPGEISKPKFYEYFIIFFLGIIPLLLGIYFHV